MIGIIVVDACRYCRSAARFPGDAELVHCRRCGSTFVETPREVLC